MLPQTTIGGCKTDDEAEKKRDGNSRRKTETQHQFSDNFIIVANCNTSIMPISVRFQVQGSNKQNNLAHS